MTTPVAVAVAPNFHLPDAPAGRVLVPDGAGWRLPTDGELSAIVPRGDPILLFALPEHLLSSFWGMLEQGKLDERFDAFASEVGRFLAFKQLPPAEHAVFELVLHAAGGKVEPRNLWAVLNLGDDPVLVGVPGLRVRLEAGEGVRLPEEVAAEVSPPEGDAPDVLLLVSRPAPGPEE